MQRSWQREAVRRALWVLALFVVGAIPVVIGGETLTVVGATIMGLALILATALVFYEIGLSEDRDRDRHR
jgi:uncharacterized membrane protein